MNIYTLHKTRSIRPPTPFVDDGDSEIENTRAFRMAQHRCRKSAGNTNFKMMKNPKSPNLDATCKFGKTACDLTSATTSSRTATTATLSPETRKSIKSHSLHAPIEPRIPSLPTQLRGNRRAMAPKRQQKQGHRQEKQLIHITDGNEFMVFRDDSDDVSRITTPSIISPVGPLESDLLIFDEEAFCRDDASLISDVTIPKALRRKKSKQKNSCSGKNKKSSDSFDRWEAQEATPSAIHRSDSIYSSASQATSRAMVSRIDSLNRQEHRLRVLEEVENESRDALSFLELD